MRETGRNLRSSGTLATTPPPPSRLSMTTSLGDLTLFFFGNTKDLERSLTEAKSKAMAVARDIEKAISGAGKGFSLNPKVNHSELTALNKHLDLKEKHFKSVQRYFNGNPLRVKTTTEKLNGERLQQETKVLESKLEATVKVKATVNKSEEQRVSVGLNDGIKKGFDGASETIKKSVKSAAPKQGLVGGIGNTLFSPISHAVAGAFTGLGLPLGEKIGGGIAKSIEKRNNISLENVGEKAEIYASEKTGKLANAALASVGLSTEQIGQDIVKFGKALDSALNPEPIGKAVKKAETLLVKALEDAFVFKDFSRSKAYAQEQLSKAGNKAKEAIQSKEARPYTGAALRTAAYPFKIRRSVEATRQYQKAEKMAEGIKVEDIGDAKSLTLAIAGKNNMQGAGSAVIAPEIQALTSNQSHVVPVANPYTDSGLAGVDYLVEEVLAKADKGLMGALNKYLTKRGIEVAKLSERLTGEKSFAQAIFNQDKSGSLLGLEQMVTTGAVLGYNPDSVSAAAHAIAYKKAYPDLPINIIGHSGGGEVAQGSAEMLSKGGIQANAVGLGTPTTGLVYAGNVGDQKVNYKALMGEKDFINWQFFGTQDAGLFKKQLEAIKEEYGESPLPGIFPKNLAPTTFIPKAGSTHALPAYLGDAKVQTLMAQHLENAIPVNEAGELDTLPEYRTSDPYAFIRERELQREKPIEAVKMLTGEEGLSTGVLRQKLKEVEILREKLITGIKGGDGRIRNFHGTGQAKEEVDQYLGFLENIENTLKEALAQGAVPSENLNTTLESGKKFFPEIASLHQDLSPVLQKNIASEQAAKAEKAAKEAKARAEAEALAKANKTNLYRYPDAVKGAISLAQDASAPTRDLIESRRDIDNLVKGLQEDAQQLEGVTKGQIDEYIEFLNNVKTNLNAVLNGEPLQQLDAIVAQADQYFNKVEQQVSQLASQPLELPMAQIKEPEMELAELAPKVETQSQQLAAELPPVQPPTPKQKSAVAEIQEEAEKTLDEIALQSTKSAKTVFQQMELAVDAEMITELKTKIASIRDAISKADSALAGDSGISKAYAQTVAGLLPDLKKQIDSALAQLPTQERLSSEIGNQLSNLKSQLAKVEAKTKATLEGLTKPLKADAKVDARLAVKGLGGQFSEQIKSAKAIAKSDPEAAKKVAANILQMAEDARSAIDAVVEASGGKNAGQPIKGAAKTARQLITRATNAATELMGDTDSASIGVNTGDGLAKGLSASIDKVKAASHELTQAVIDTAEKTLDIRSPSRVFEGIGRFVVQGFQKGLDAIKPKPGFAQGLVEESQKLVQNAQFKPTKGNTQLTKSVKTEAKTVQSQAQSLLSEVNAQLAQAKLDEVAARQIEQEIQSAQQTIQQLNQKISQESGLRASGNGVLSEAEFDQLQAKVAELEENILQSKERQEKLGDPSVERIRLEGVRTQAQSASNNAGEILSRNSVGQEEVERLASAREQVAKLHQEMGKPLPTGGFLPALELKLPGLIKQLGSMAKNFVLFQGAMYLQNVLFSFSGVAMEAATAMESLERRFSFASGSFEAGAKNIAFVRGEVKRLGTDIKSSMEGFVQLSASTKETSLEGEPTKEIFSAVSQASTVYDLNAEKQGRVFTAIQQMASKGTVSSEELRQQLGESLPGAFQIAARAMGVTTQQLGKMLEQGKVLSDDFLPKFAQQLSAETSSGVTGAANSSVSAVIGFNNALFDMQAAMGKSFLPGRNAILRTLASLLNFVKDNAQILADVMKFLSIVVGVMMVKNVTTLIAALAKIPGVAGAAASTMAALNAAMPYSDNKQKAANILAGFGEGARNARANPVQSIGGFFQGIGNTAKGKAITGFEGIKSAITGMGSALVGLRVNAGVTFATMTGGVKAFGIAAITNGMAGIMTLIGGIRVLLASLGPVLLLFLAFEAVIQIWDQIQFATKDAGGATRDFANTAADGLKRYQESVNAALGKTQELADSQKKLGFWGGLKRNLIDNPRMAVSDGLDKVGLGGVARFLRPRDETVKRDTLKASDESLATGRKLISETTSAQTTKVVGDLKAIDKQLAAIGVKRRAAVALNPGDKATVRKLDAEQATLLDKRAKLAQPTGILSQQLQAQVEGYKAQLEELKRLNDKWRNNEIGGIDSEEYAKRTAEIRAELEKTQLAQEAFTRSIGEAATAFTLLQKNIKAVADDLADSGDRITIASGAAKANLSQQQITGNGLTPGQIQAGTTAISIAEQTARTKKLEEAIVTQRGLLSTEEAQGTLADYQVDQNTGQARLKTISESATGNDKFYLESFANIKAQEVELAQAKAQLLDAKAGAVQQIRDANKQIAEYYTGVQRQTAELALSAKEAENQLAVQGQKNRLKSALLGFQDSYITEFVNGIIESVDMLNQPLQDAIDSQKQSLQNRFSFEDQQKQALELKRSLPTMPTIEVGLDFSGIDSDGNVQKLEQGLQGTVETTKQLSEGHKQVVNAITSQFNPLYQVQQGIQGGVESSSELGQSILANATATGELGSEINANTLGLSNNLLKSDEVNQSLAGVVDTTGQVVGKTNELSSALGGVDMSTQNFGVSLASTGSVFDQLIAKAQELGQQTASMAAGLAVSSMPGMGAFAPGVAVAADAAMGQAMQQGGGSGAKLGGAAAPGQPIFPIAGVSLEQANSKKTSPWGMRRHPVTGQMKMHRGQDYGFAEGTQVVSPTAGIVTKVAYQEGGAGKYVVVESLDEKGNKVEHKFFHLSAFDVKQGDKVQAGGKVGKVGATGIGTGAHLHYETWINGKNSDPLAYLAGNSGRGRLTQEQKNALGGHHPGDGHNHFGEDDVKAANQKAAAQAPAPVVRTVGGGAGAPKLGQGYDALNELGGQLAQNKYFNPSTAEGRGRLAIALGIGGSEAFEKNTTRRSFYTYKGGTGNNMQGFGQFNNAYHKDIINTPEKYQNFFGQILAGERRLPNSQKGIGDYGAELTKAVQSGQVQTGQQLIKWMQANKLGGSNWQGVDDGWKRNPDLANQLVQYLKGSLPTQSGGGGMPTSAQAIQSAQATMAPVMQQAQITGSKLPPVTYNPRSAAGLSGSTVNTRQLSAAEQQQAKNFEQQEGIRTAQLRSKLESDQIDFIKTQERNLRQLGVAGRESDDSALQSSRATEDMAFETGEPKSLGEQGQRKITEILRRFDDREKELQRSISKTKDTIGAGEAAIASGEVTGANRVALEARLEAERKNLKGYESDLVKVQKLRGEAIASAEKLNQREQEIQDKANKASLEGAKIETLEAKLSYLKERQGRGERGGEIDGIPALEKLIGLKRQQAEYEQKIQAIDERVFKKEVSPEMAAQEKKEINDKLDINKKAITESAAYAEKVMGRENDKRSREERIGTMRGELAVMKEQLTTAKEAAQLNPQDPRAAWIPQAEQEIQLKEAALDLEEKIAAVEDKRFSKELTDEAANKQIESLRQENDALVKNIELRADRASKEAEFAARRAEVDNKSFEVDLQSQLTEARGKNQELRGTPGFDPLKARYDIQSAQQTIGFTKQMIDLDELEASGKRTKEEIDKLRAAYTELNSISLDNLKAEWEQAQQDKALGIQQKMVDSSTALMDARASGFSARGMTWKAREIQKDSAITKQEMSYQQQTADLEKFIKSQGLSVEKAQQLRSELGQLNQVQLGNINAEFDPWTQQLGTMQGAFKGFFSDVLTGSKSIGDAFKGMVDQILGGLADMAAEWLTNKLFGDLFGMNKEGANPGQFYAGTLSNSQNPQQPQNPLNNIVPFGGSQGGGEFGFATGMSLGANPMQPMYVSDVSQSPLGGMPSGSIFGGTPDLFGSPDVGMGFVDSLFGSGETLPVNILGANDSFFSGMSDGLGGVLGSVFSAFGGGGGGMGGIGSIASAMVGAFTGGGGGGAGGGGLGGLGGFAMNLLGGLFYDGGVAGKDGEKFAIGNYAHGGIAEQMSKAVSREKAMNGGRPVVPAVLTAGERVLTTQQNEKFEKLGGMRILNFAQGGTVPGGSFAKSVGDKMSSNVNVSVPINISGGEGGGGMDENKIRTVLDSRVRRILEEEARQGGVLSQRFSKR